ncbi:T9SS type A sorting domain-containing protein [Taibaiella koreensis]|uniref:T9SS type A sorting domain-containing protein n=1 Tax=Taibaiella koreensis TaxID=1268548 RepID=UPI0013C31D29|nr:T9SS type A sorting domain-containing protein [Taibaiella koreensis]
MMRKILPLLFLFGLSSAAVHAQDFVLKADTITAETPGQTPPTGSGWDNYTIKLFDYAINKTNAALPFSYTIFSRTIPIGWGFYAFCDNQTCRTSGDPTLSGTETVGMPIPANDSSVLEPQFSIPVEADNGVGIIRVKVVSANTIDTATYIINKTPTGVSTISIKDKRVAVYPNPATTDLILFTDRSLNASRVEILNITGARQLTQSIDNGAEAIRIDISMLAKGMYLAKVTNASGAVITTRKFSKE